MTETNGNGGEVQQTRQQQQMQPENIYRKVELWQHNNKMHELEEYNRSIQDNRRSLFGVKRKDSEEMLAVKQYQQQITALMNDTMPDDDADFEVALDGIKESYEQLIQASRTYIATHKNPITFSGKARLKMVLQNLALAEKEIVSLSLRANMMRDAAKQQGTNLLFASALAGVRGAEFDLNKQRTEQTGAGTSEVTVIHVGQEKLFFKEKEELCTPQEEFEKEFLQKPMSQEDMLIYEEIKQIVTNETVFFGLSSTIQTKLKKADTDEKLEEAFSALSIETEAFAQINLKNAHIRIILRDVLLKYTKWMTRSDVCKEAGIENGENLSDRNILMSRAALLVKASQVLANSNTATIHHSGENEQVGIAMEQAKGIGYGELVNGPDWENLIYTPEAVRQFSCLRLLDSICGQIDRHVGNMFVTTKEVNGKIVITGVQGIDNDMALGKLDFESLKQKQKALLPIIDENGNCAIPAIDAEMFQMMKGMTEESLGYFFGDMLKGEYLKALWSRWEGLVNLIEKEAEKNPNLIVKKEDWNAEVAQRFAGNKSNYIILNKKENIASNPQ